MNPHAKMRDAPKGRGSKDPIWEPGYGGTEPGQGGRQTLSALDLNTLPEILVRICNLAAPIFPPGLLLVGPWPVRPGSMGE